MICSTIIQSNKIVPLYVELTLGALRLCVLSTTRVMHALQQVLPLARNT
jgi:hypothetical protein